MDGYLPKGEKTKKVGKELPVGTEMRFRCMGLNPWATTLVRGEHQRLYDEVVTRFWTDGRVEVFPRESVFHSAPVKTRKEPNQDDAEMSGLLCVYPSLPGPRKVEEAVQQRIEHPVAGPVIFLALKEGGNWILESLWTESDMARTIGDITFVHSSGRDY